MSLRPKIGVLLPTSGWFREVGLQDPSGDTTARVETVARELVRRLEEFADAVFPGVLFSVEEARRAGQAIRAAGVDGLLLAPLMWCEDQIVRAALGGLRDLPLVMWTFSPESSLPEFVPFQTMIQGSGAVCTLQLSGMLRRERYSYRSVAGHAADPEAWGELRAALLAMGIGRALRSLRVGVLPFPCQQMSTTYVDEFSLRHCYGVQLVYLELERFRRAAAAATVRELAALRQEIERDTPGLEVKVDEANLAEGLRYALAMERILAEERLQALAMNDVIPQMHASFGLRPCLSNPRLTRAGVVVSMEADVAAAVCMYVLRLFTGQAPFYTETFSADYDANCLLLGHAGYHDAVNADPSGAVQIVSDVEYRNTDRFSGAVSFFKYRPGPVTVVNSVWDGQALKWMAVQGDSLPGPARMDGNSHLLCHLGFPVREFFRRAVESGVSQHWIVVPGHRLAGVKGLCAQLGIRLLALSP